MPRDLDERVFRFACRIVDLFEMLYAKGGAVRAVGYQLLEAGTSVGSNYEEASAGQTKADFIAKLAIFRKESRDRYLRGAGTNGHLARNHRESPILAPARVKSPCIASMAHWCILALAHWRIGALVHSCIGALVHFKSSPLRRTRCRSGGSTPPRGRPRRVLVR
jgi:hypothetical protein